MVVCDNLRMTADIAVTLLRSIQSKSHDSSILPSPLHRKRSAALVLAATMSVAKPIWFPNHSDHRDSGICHYNSRYKLVDSLPQAVLGVSHAHRFRIVNDASTADAVLHAASSAPMLIRT